MIRWSNTLPECNPAIKRKKYCLQVDNRRVAGFRVLGDNEEDAVMKYCCVFLSMTLLFICLTGVASGQTPSLDPIRIFLAGDSTVANGTGDGKAYSLLGRLSHNAPPGCTVVPLCDEGDNIIDYNMRTFKMWGAGGTCTLPNCTALDNCLGFTSTVFDCFTSYDPQYVMIVLGVNDLTRSMMEDYGGDVDEAIQEAKNFFLRLQRQGFRVIYVSNYPLTTVPVPLGVGCGDINGGPFGGGNMGCPAAGECMSRFNSNYEYFLQQLNPWLASNDIGFIDTFQWVRDTYPDTNDFVNTYSMDGVHISTDGAAIWYNFVYNELAKIVENTTPPEQTAILEVSENQVIFPLQAVDTTQSKTLLLLNTGNTSLEVTDVSILGIDAARFNHDFSGAITVDPGAPATLTITCTPTSAGPVSAILTIAHSGENPMVMVALAGQGVVPSTTLEVRVATGSDDAEEDPIGSMSLGSSDLELTFAGSDQTVGMRFNQVDIPQGALIANAFIQFQVDETSSQATELEIRAEATGDAPTFTSSSWDISSRDTTQASVLWFPLPWLLVGEAGSDQRTPDISPVIQEVVNRPDWVSGNAMVLIVTGTGKRVAESYNGERGGAPLLHVAY